MTRERPGTLDVKTCFSITYTLNLYQSIDIKTQVL